MPKKASFLEQDQLKRRSKPEEASVTIETIECAIERLRQNVIESQVIYPIWGAIEVLYLQRYKPTTIKKVIKRFILERYVPQDTSSGLPYLGYLQEYLWDNSQPEAQAILETFEDKIDDLWKKIYALTKEIFQEIIDEHRT